MKYFTHPKGIFEIKIPLDWHYKNEVAGYENESPFSFELFEEAKGCFQISCYHQSEKPLNPSLPKHDYNTANLKFIPAELPDSEFKVLLWATIAGEYFFMAKYIYQPNKFAIDNLNQFWADSQAFILMAAVIYIIATIFKKGVEIQNENDLTV